jgi:hypothetical protein
MGMDVYGSQPTDSKGEYFRNNIWWWRPLWNYVEENFPDIAQKVPGAHYNAGDGLNAEDSLLLASLMQDHIDRGLVKKFETTWKDTIENAPDEPCEYCSQTGARKWEAGSIQNDTAQDLYKECNVCNGTGMKKSFITMYPFSEENVIEFTEFLKSCGGFSIC